MTASVRELGKTGLQIPPIVFGTSALGNLYQAYSDDLKLAILREMVSSTDGPVVLDSAGKYGAGLALEVIGNGLRTLGVPPEKVIISNKLAWIRTPLRAPVPTFEPGVWFGLSHDAEQAISYEGILRCWGQGCDLLGAPYRPRLVSVHDPDEFLNSAASPAQRQRVMQDIAGAYRIYEFNVTAYAEPGKVNVLAAEVIAPTPDDLAVNWVDWNPTPPDKNMGLWGDVSVSASGPVSVRYPAVSTHFADNFLKQADLTVRAELQNATAKPVDGVLEASFDQVHLQQKIQLQPNQKVSVALTPEQYPQLRIKDPKIWWPAEMGTPNLHRLTVRFLVNGQLSDESETRFGIREVTSELTPQNYRLFRVNGKPILIRGGAWDHDMLLRPMTHEQYDAHFQYVHEMHLNTIRQEGQLETDEFYDLADEYGILIMAGWCCCDVWEQWDKWLPGTLDIATDSLRTEMLKMRSHPSMLTWLNGSDGPPPPDVEQAYLEVEKQVGWPNPVVSSASDQSTTLTGKSGVKMSGPYDYEPPSYWLEDKSKWGAVGATTPRPGPVRRFLRWRA